MTDQAIEAAEAAGAQYARDQFDSDYFHDWVWQQVSEADRMRRADPASVIDDPNEIARNMLQQLGWDIKRDMGAREILPLIETGDDESASERELVKAFFEGLNGELHDRKNRDWLAELVTEMGAEVSGGGEKVSEARRRPHETDGRLEARRQPNKSKIGSIEDDTGILPYAVADGVLDEVQAFTGDEILDARALADRLAAMADETYKHNERFRKQIRANGDRGRDQLWVWMRHWVASELHRHYPAIYRKLPSSFATGHPLPGYRQESIAREPGLKKGEKQQAAIAKVIATFPETFGLRGYPDYVFRIGKRESYFSGDTLNLYTQRLVKGKWVDFAKGSEDELRAQIVPPVLGTRETRGRGPARESRRPTPTVPGAGHGLEWHRSRDSFVGLVDGERRFLLDPSADGDWILWAVNPKTGVQTRKIDRFSAAADAKDAARRRLDPQTAESRRQHTTHEQVESMADRLLAAGAKTYTMMPDAVAHARGNPAQAWFFALSSRREDARVVDASIGKSEMDRLARRIGGIVKLGYVVNGVAYVLPKSSAHQ